MFSSRQLILTGVMLLLVTAAHGAMEHFRNPLPVLEWFVERGTVIGRAGSDSWALTVTHPDPKRLPYDLRLVRLDETGAETDEVVTGFVDFFNNALSTKDASPDPGLEFRFTNTWGAFGGKDVGAHKWVFRRNEEGDVKQLKVMFYKGTFGIFAHRVLNIDFENVRVQRFRQLYGEE